jgi:hypothetical protein
MKKLFLFTFFFSSILTFSQENGKLINSFRLYSGFNNVGDPKGLDLFQLDPIVGTFDYNRMVKTGIKEVRKKYDYDFAWLDLPSINFYVNASIEHKLMNDKLSWFIGLNYISTRRRFNDFAETYTREFDQAFENNVLVYSKDSIQIVERLVDMKLSITAIENSFSFSTNQDKRISAYVGATVQLGFVSNVTKFSLENSFKLDEVFHDSLDYVSSSDSYEPSRNTLSYNYNFYENSIQSYNPYFSINATLGTNILITGKNRENRRLYLFSEFKPGYAFMYVNKAKSMLNYYNGFFSLFGFRYKI